MSQHFYYMFIFNELSWHDVYILGQTICQQAYFHAYSDSL